MGLVSIGAIALGVALLVIGVARARGPWSRYQELKAQDANIARYESWRGGIRDSGRTGASAAMELFRARARNGAIIAGLGFVLAVAGLVIR